MAITRQLRYTLLLVAVALVMLAPALAHATTDEEYPADVTAIETDDTERSESSTAQLEFQTIDELAGKRIGLPSGGVFDQLIAAYAPSITDFQYFDTYADMVGALKAGKVDAFMLDKPVCQLLVSRNTGIALLPEVLVDDDYGFILPKGSKRTDELNEVIERLRSDGTLDALIEKWTGADEAAKTLPTKEWDTSAGTLNVVVDNMVEPIAYTRGREIAGYDVELAMICAKELGMDIKMRGVPFAALLSSIQSGKADLGIGCISITDERKQTMDFTVPTYYGAAVFVVRTAGNTGQEAGSFFRGLISSFQRTFVTEARWKLIVSSLGVTILITVLSGSLGTILGFASVLLCRRGNRVVIAIVRAFEGLMGRLPIVVILMVFYYVVFASFNVSGIVVSVIAFTLTFGASTGSIMWNAVESVDVGQNEASLALGFTDDEAFFGVVFPQAARRFLPLLSGQLVSLCKDTAVVGYIAVQDLTRASDLIRSRTMEAFFPLLSSAAIYFTLCCVLAALMGIVVRRFDLERRPRTIKGVQL